MGLSRPTTNPNLEAEIEKCDGSEAKTQELLQPLFQKPQLTEKLLQKPPFRFLFDIVMAVIKNTNFGLHLYSAEEMDFNNINDKEKKILFLEKIIKCIGSSLNTIVEAKPAKIIAGADPQNTNSMLQLLAVAAKNVPNSNSQVKAVLDELGGGNPAALATSGGAQRMDSARSTDFSSAEPKQEVSKSDKAKVVESHKPEVDLSAPRREITRHEDDSKSSQHHGSAGDDADGDAENKRNARPTTARRRPPKVKDEDAAGAKEVAVVKKAEGIMVDGQNDDDDDIVEDEKRLADDVKSARGASSENQSKLVQDIISRQVEQETAKMTDSVNQDDAKAVDDENKGGIRFKKKVSSDKKIVQPGTAAAVANSSSTIKAKYSSSEIDRIRNSIQLLVQNTGPLGSCMDFIQEDVGLMTSELHKWEEECRTYDAILDQEKRKTQETLMPLQQQLSDVEEQITDQLMKISSIKAAITRNDENILKALGQISSA
jgi:TRAF3-interacting protein 1